MEVVRVLLISAPAVCAAYVVSASRGPGHASSHGAFDDVDENRAPDGSHGQAAQIVLAVRPEVRRFPWVSAA
jgi:hypothetical protein